MSNAADTLTAAGWTVTDYGQWLSPLTRRPFDERTALALASIKPRSHNPIYRPKESIRRTTR